MDQLADGGMTKLLGTVSSSSGMDAKKVATTTDSGECRVRDVRGES